MLYPLLRKLLFQLDPEAAHQLTLQGLGMAEKFRVMNKLNCMPADNPTEIMGLSFPNRIGLAAGFDKNAERIDALSALGFGFIEIGTVTPKPQEGNPRPRIFRLTEEQAIINRLGFNSKGVDYVCEQLDKTKYRGILGINLGKNKDTALENAIDDYVSGFKRLHKYASYITINISSPNTPYLRELQQAQWIQPLLQTLKRERDTVTQRYIPLVVKISPDMTTAEIETLAGILLDEKIDGVIATNTTLSRPGVEDNPLAKEEGGLSGAPLTSLSTAVIQRLHTLLQDRIPIIASGGIMNEVTAREKFSAGAKLLQIYTGMIYAGPGLIKQLNRIESF